MYDYRSRFDSVCVKYAEKSTKFDVFLAIHAELCILYNTIMVAAFGEILFDVYPDKELLGGAPFNFLYHIHALTGKGVFISRIGNDPRGVTIRKFMEDHAIDRSMVQIDMHKPTGAAFVTLDKDGVPGFRIAEETAYDYIEHAPDAPDLLADCEILYYGTLAQRNETSRNSLYLISQHADRCFFDVNLRQNFYSTEILQRSLILADIVKMNEDELKKIHELFFSSAYSQKTASKELLERFSLSHLAVTMGGDGSTIYTPDGSHTQKTPAASVIDTVGAGDGFAAMLCAGLVKQRPLELIHRLASDFSAELCGIHGALPENDRIYDVYRKALNND